MTKAQDKWYWREWGKVVRYCKAHDMAVPDRHDLHTRALGADKSHLLFDDDDFDDILSAFLSISEPDNLEAQVSLANMRKTRRVYACRRNALKAVGPAGAENYIGSICQDKFHTSDWECLDLERLRQLRDTLAARASSHKKKENQPF